MRATSRRGFVLVYVIFVVAILAVLTAVLWSSAQRAAGDTRELELKDGSFNAAEAGLNAALDALDVSLLNVSGRQGTLANGYKYAYKVYPNFTGLSALAITDPVLGKGQINIPLGSAVIVSTGTGPNGERPSTVEAVVTADVTLLSFQKYAVLTGRNVQGDFSSNLDDKSGSNAANVHADDSVNAQVQGVQGTVTASGSTNTLPPHTVRAPVVTVPTVSQFDYMVANYRNQSKLLANSENLYVPSGSSLSPAYACPSASLFKGCLLFYDGPLELTTQQITFSGQWTTVVNGDYKQTGLAGLQFLNAPSTLVVNGNATIEGNDIAGGYLLVKGNTDLGGMGVFNGAVLTLGNLSFRDGGPQGGFMFDAAVIPPPQTIVGLVKVVTYAEY